MCIRDRAYAGSATIEVPADLAAALDASPTAGAAFAALNSAGRYSILHPLVSAPNEATRASRLKKIVSKLEGA